MKIRNGFVSNSSSSSFIVALPKVPDSVEELKEILFKDNSQIEYYSKSADTLEVAKHVFNDIFKFITVNEDKSLDEILFNIVSYDFYDKKTWDYCYNESNGYIDMFNNKLYETLCLPLIQKKIEEYKKTLDLYNNKFLFTVDYSDNDGDLYCILEHGGIFDNVKHILFYNH